MPQSYDVVAFSSMTTRAGSAIRLRSLCRHLARRGCRVLLTERAYPGDVALAESNLTHWLYRTEHRPLPLALAASLWNNLRVAASVRARVVLALKPLPNAALPALLLGLRGARTVVDVDDLDPEYYRSVAARSAVGVVFRRIPRCFEHVVTHNRFLREILQAECGVDADRIADLPQGIELERFRGICPDDGLRQHLGLTGKRVVAYLASLGMTSDLDEALPALARFAASDERRAVLVVGGGSRLAELRERTGCLVGGDKVVFAGPVPHEEVPRYLGLCVAGFNYMADTRANRCRASIKVREYMAAGLRVVCNPVGELGDLEGLFVSYRTPEGIAAALEQALGDDTQGQRERARAWVEDRCDWDRIAATFLVDVGFEPGGSPGVRARAKC
ncbi:MAG: glycosyltransferase [Deltaproteobacteria bacterium]|nr:glycosyltransferase [Deltaproteobacteria bacterium]